MKICGIICEYNPFHNGHAYHIQKAKEITGCDILICVMSGNFVQRGEMAICDKWTRAKTAIQNGCDLVVELPYPFVVQRADRFAHGAINILKQANIDSLVFGSECGDIGLLQAFANQEIDIKKHQTLGVSSAKALENAYQQKLSSNDMLGVFYIKELLGTHITPHCIKRTNAYHEQSITSSISSASAIRRALKEGYDITHTTCMPKEELQGFDWQALYPYIQTFLMNTSKQHLSSLFLMDEGIESLLKKQAQLHSTYDSFLNGCISRRYTKSKIQRTLAHMLTQTTKVEMNTLAEPQHIRILAYNQNGQNYLRILQGQNKQIASTFTKIPKPYRELEYRATTAFAHPYPLEDRNNILKRELQCAEAVK